MLIIIIVIVVLYFLLQPDRKRQGVVKKNVVLDRDYDEKWEAIRTEAFQHFGHECNICGSHENLQVHHKLKKTMGGLDEIENLEVLCRDCHEAKHGFYFEAGNYNKDHTANSAIIRSEKTNTIIDAIKNNHDIKFDYRKKDYNTGSIDTTNRAVTPLEIFEEKSRIYLRGYCHLRKEKRTFRISRITNLIKIK